MTTVCTAPMQLLGTPRAPIPGGTSPTRGLAQAKAVCIALIAGAPPALLLVFAPLPPERAHLHAAVPDMMARRALVASGLVFGIRIWAAPSHPGHLAQPPVGFGAAGSNREWRQPRSRYGKRGPLRRSRPGSPPGLSREDFGVSSVERWARRRRAEASSHSRQVWLPPVPLVSYGAATCLRERWRPL